MTPSSPGSTEVRLWDLPIRIVHWSFVPLLAALWWTGEEGDIETHALIGTILLAVLVFRILWGFVGSSTARFGQFLRGPASVIRYLRGGLGEPVVGHNPAGGWSVVVLLAVLLSQVVLGLFAQDVDGIASGPLSYLVNYDTADLAREWHHTVFNFILVVSALHVLAVLFYLVVRRNNLIGPMMSGRRKFAANVAIPRFVSIWRAVLCAVAASMFAWWVYLGAPFLDGL